MADAQLRVLINARDRASSVFGRIGRGVRRLTGLFGKLTGVVGAFSAALLARKALTAFARQEAAERNLAAALESVGAGGVAATERMKEFAASVQAVTTEGDEAVLELARLGVTLGGLSGKQLEDATRAAIGLSRAIGVDARTAMNLLARAAQGNTALLSRYGIVLDQSKSKQEQFNEILQRGIKNFQLARDETDTLEGQYKQFTNSVGDFFEVMGERIAEAFNLIGDEGESALTRMRKGLDDLTRFFDQAPEGSFRQLFFAELNDQLAPALGLGGGRRERVEADIVNEFLRERHRQDQQTARRDLLERRRQALDLTSGDSFGPSEVQRARNLLKAGLGPESEFASQIDLRRKLADAEERIARTSENLADGLGMFRGAVNDGIDALRRFPLTVKGVADAATRGQATAAVLLGQQRERARAALDEFFQFESGLREQLGQVSQLGRAELIDSPFLTGVGQRGRDPVATIADENQKQTKALENVHTSIEQLTQELTQRQLIGIVGAGLRGR